MFWTSPPGFNDLENSATTSDLSSKLSATQSKASDAQQQYKALQKSAVLKDKSTNQKFQALAAKWSTYNTYIQNRLSDDKLVGPIALGLKDQISQLTSTTPTTTVELSTYLTNFQNVLDSENTKFSGLKLALPENQQGSQAIKDFLSSASKVITTAKSDLAANKLSAVDTDLLGIDGAETTLSSATTKSDSQTTKHEQQVDPTDAITGLQSALDGLRNKVSP